MIEIKNFQKEYNELIENIRHIEVNSKNLILILEYVIDVVEKIEGVKGNKKKALAILFITKLVEESGLNETDKKMCNDMIKDGIIGDTIDLVINAANGKLDINQVIDTGSKCCFFFLKRGSKEKRKKVLE